MIKLKSFVLNHKYIVAGSAMGTALLLYKLFAKKKQIKYDKPLINDNFLEYFPLSEGAAKNRADVISNITYKIYLNFSKGKMYQGKVVISFNLSSISPSPLYLNFNGDIITRYFINDQNVLYDNSLPLQDSLFTDHKIILPSEYLKTDILNIVEIIFDSHYFYDSHGICSFEDYDGLQYIYTNNEPFYCNRIFPCFDQPNLRAIFDLSVITPEEWIAASNEKSLGREKFDEDRQPSEDIALDNIIGKTIWRFHPTKSIPSYIFCVIAGPYAMFTCDKSYKNIDMALYCRQSLAKYMIKQKNEIFELTNHGLQFYENFYGIEYQFSKYDHVFCPDYHTVAMENPGLVAMEDNFIFKSDESIDRKFRRAYILLHEMAHMCFGDLVTIQWFDSTWIKESFASFYGYLAISEIPELREKFPDIWERCEIFKERAYIADEIIDLRHPVAAKKIENTRHAEINYDNITYNKGAGILKILYQIIGKQKYKQINSNYLSDFKWGAATSKDVFNMWRKHLKDDPAMTMHGGIDQFISEWFENTGTDVVGTAWDENPEDFKISVKLFRQPNSSRRHTINCIVLYDDPERKREFSVMFNNDEDTKVLPLNDAIDVKAVLLNFDGTDFVQVILNQKTLKYLNNNLHKAEIKKYEKYFWRNLAWCVKMNKLSWKDYCTILALNLYKESSLIVEEGIIGDDNNEYQMHAFAIRKFMAVIAPLMTKQELEDQLKAFFRITYDRLKGLNGDGSNDKVDMLLDRLMTFATQTGEIRLLRNWLAGKEIASLKGLRKPSTDEAMTILKLWYTQGGEFNIEDFNTFLDQYDDNSEEYKSFRQAIRFANEHWKCEDDENLTKFWTFIRTNTDLFKHGILHNLIGLTNTIFNQKSCNKSYCQAFFYNIEQIYLDTTNMISDEIFNGLFPIYHEDIEFVIKCTDEVMSRRKPNDFLGCRLVEKQYELINKQNHKKLKPLL